MLKLLISLSCHHGTFSWNDADYEISCVMVCETDSIKTHMHTFIQRFCVFSLAYYQSQNGNS